MTATMRPARYVVIALALSGASPALAQTAPRPPRVLVSINAGMQLTGERAAQELTPVINGEPSSVSVSTPFQRGLSFDGGATIASAARSASQPRFRRIRKTAGRGVGQIPHPLQFNRPRTLTGTATGLSRTEVGVHVDAAYIAKSRGRVSAVVSAGVSISTLADGRDRRQLLETYPFDSVSFTSATTVSASTAAVGFNGGVDVTWKLSRRAGIGALRDSRARPPRCRPRAAATSAPAPAGWSQAPRQVWSLAGHLHASGGDDDLHDRPLHSSDRRVSRALSEKRHRTAGRRAPVPGVAHEPAVRTQQLQQSLPRPELRRPEPRLGGRRRAAKDSKNTGWRNMSFRGYADHMATGEFKAALASLIALAQEKTTAIMCAEAVPWRCHRFLIADALTHAGWRVLHITGSAAPSQHKFTPFLRVRGDELTYPPEQPDLELK